MVEHNDVMIAMVGVVLASVTTLGLVVRAMLKPKATSTGSNTRSAPTR